VSRFERARIEWNLAVGRAYADDIANAATEPSFCVLLKARDAEWMAHTAMGNVSSWVGRETSFAFDERALVVHVGIVRLARPCLIP
jgi:hypothetical protein